MYTWHKSAAGNSPTQPPAVWLGHVAVHAQDRLLKSLNLKYHTTKPLYVHSNHKHQMLSHNHKSSNQQVREQHLILSQVQSASLSCDLRPCITGPTLYVRSNTPKSPVRGLIAGLTLALVLGQADLGSISALPLAANKRYLSG